MAASTSSIAKHPGFETIRFATRAEFHQHLLSGIAQAQRSIWMADHDFSQWPLNQPEVESQLQSFLHASRANVIHLLVQAPDVLMSRTPRFMRLLRLHSQSIHCRTPPQHLAHRFSEDCSFMIVDQISVVRRFQRDSMRGIVEKEPGAANGVIEQFQSVWEEAQTGLSSTVLGLGA